MSFYSPYAFILLVALPLALFLYWRWSRTSSLSFSSAALCHELPRSLKLRLRPLILLSRFTVLTLLIVAFARPREGIGNIKNISRGIAIQMLIDRSGSMGARMDFDRQVVDRLTVVKQVFTEFVFGNEEDLPGRRQDLIGIISFARYADTVAPLTLAHDALSALIEKVALVTRKSEDGTGIGDAIALAAARLRKAEEAVQQQSRQREADFEIKSKIIILLTDGQNNVGTRKPLEAAALAKEWGITIYTIGIGKRRANAGGFLGSLMGRLQVPQVDIKGLKKIAEATGGKFWLASDAHSLREIYREIDNLEKSEVQSIEHVEYHELFFWPVCAAMMMLMFEILLANTYLRSIP